jgi:hemerythrin-like metal-binding protein
MTMLAWNPDWNTGIEKIDQQHRNLFSQISLLLEALRKNEAQERIPGLLDFLAEYVEGHFSEEEQAMEASAYPGLARHQAVHDGMREKVADLLLQFQADPRVMTPEVMEFLMEWLTNHINTEDKRLADHLRAASPSTRS